MLGLVGPVDPTFVVLRPGRDTQRIPVIVFSDVEADVTVGELLALDGQFDLEGSALRDGERPETVAQTASCGDFLCRSPISICLRSFSQFFCSGVCKSIPVISFAEAVLLGEVTAECLAHLCLKGIGVGAGMKENTARFRGERGTPGTSVQSATTRMILAWRLSSAVCARDLLDLVAPGSRDDLLEKRVRTIERDERRRRRRQRGPPSGW